MTKQAKFVLLVFGMVSVGLGLGFSQPPQPLPIMESGTLIYVDKGQKLGEEAFSLVQLREPEFQLISNTTLTVREKTFRWSSHLRLDGNWYPLSYILDALTPTARTVILTEIKGKQITFSVSVGGKLQSKTITSEKELFIKDNNVNSHFAVLHRLWRARGSAASLELTGIVPQSTADAPMRIEYRGMVTLKADSKEIKAEMLTMTIKGTQFEIFVDAQGLLGFAIPGQTTPFGYLQERFPNGFTIVRR